VTAPGALAQAIRTKDVDGLMRHYAADLVTFDVRPPLQVRADEYRKNFEAWFASMKGPIDYLMEPALGWTSTTSLLGFPVSRRPRPATPPAHAAVAPQASTAVP
jgi:hypothetical protein